MSKLLVRIGMALLGMVVTLAWWTYHDKGSNVQSSNHIPAKLGNGGNQMEIWTQTSTPSAVRITFEDIQKPAGQQILLETWEKIPAGTRNFTVEVPSGVGGYIELEADHPNPGDTLSARMKINGKEVEHQTERLDSPLQPNTAFFVQFHYDDFSNATALVDPNATE